MERVMVGIAIDEIEKAVEQFSPEEQERLEKKLWALRMDPIVNKMRKAARRNKITEKDIEKTCKEVRKELYEKCIARGN
ncbi:MAG: hypothetical protein M1501_00965 [Candidatus Omnitrophica bacterium]|nr:hypothetical protein [Candidatus Omnitrophota bacterium]